MANSETHFCIKQYQTWIYTKSINLPKERDLNVRLKFALSQILQRQGISFGSNETLVICSNGGADTEKVSRGKSQVRYSWTTS